MHYLRAFQKSPSHNGNLLWSSLALTASRHPWQLSSVVSVGTYARQEATPGNAALSTGLSGNLRNRLKYPLYTALLCSVPPLIVFMTAVRHTVLAIKLAQPSVEQLGIAHTISLIRLKQLLILSKKYAWDIRKGLRSDTIFAPANCCCDLCGRLWLQLVSHSCRKASKGKKT